MSNTETEHTRRTFASAAEMCRKLKLPMYAYSLAGRTVLLSGKRARPDGGEGLESFDRTRTVEQFVYMSKTGEVKLELLEEEGTFFLVEVATPEDEKRAQRGDLKFADVNGEVSFVHLAD